MGSNLGARIFKYVAKFVKGTECGEEGQEAVELIGGSGNDIASESLRFQGAQGLAHWDSSKWFLGKSSWRSMRGEGKRQRMKEREAKTQAEQ